MNAVKKYTLWFVGSPLKFTKFNSADDSIHLHMLFVVENREIEKNVFSNIHGFQRVEIWIYFIIT